MEKYSVFSSQILSVDINFVRYDTNSVTIFQLSPRCCKKTLEFSNSLLFLLFY